MMEPILLSIQEGILSALQTSLTRIEDANGYVREPNQFSLLPVSIYSYSYRQVPIRTIHKIRVGATTRVSFTRH